MHSLEHSSSSRTKRTASIKVPRACGFFVMASGTFGLRRCSASICCGALECAR
jgi:hypothetical protein